MREKDLPIDLAKHKVYSKNARKCVRKILRRYYDRGVSEVLWEKIQLKYCEFLEDERGMVYLKNQKTASGHIVSGCSPKDIYLMISQRISVFGSLLKDDLSYTCIVNYITAVTFSGTDPEFGSGNGGGYLFRLLPEYDVFLSRQHCGGDLDGRELLLSDVRLVEHHLELAVLLEEIEQLDHEFQAAFYTVRSHIRTADDEPADPVGLLSKKQSEDSSIAETVEGNISQVQVVHEYEYVISHIAVMEIADLGTLSVISRVKSIHSEMVIENLNGFLEYGMVFAVTVYHDERLAAS